MNTPSLLDKWLFLGGVMSAPDLSDLARRIAYLLLDLYDPSKGGAWPSLDTIQARTGTSRQGCLKAIRQLEGGSWFMKRAGHGRVSSIYTPCWGRLEVAPTEGALADAVSVNPGRPKAEDVLVNAGEPKEGLSVNPSSLNEQSFGQLSHSVLVNPSCPDSSYRTLLGSIDSPTLFPDDAIVAVLPTAKAPKPAKPPFPEEAFAEFWTVYPRHVDEDAARGAYREALKKGATPAGLIASASAYAAAVAQDDTPVRYIKKPANFLRHGAWKDAPEDQSPYTAGNSNPRRQSIQDAASRVFADTPEARAFREAL